MSTGFNVIICGSSDITRLHIHTIKKIKFFKIIGIFSNNKKKLEKLSKDYNLEIIEDLDEQNLKKFNLAVITSSTSDHLKYFNILSNYIKNIIIEKPIVTNSTEFEELKKIKRDREIYVKEISLFEKENSFLFNDIEIKIRKKRDTSDFLNYKNKIDRNKSPIFNHLTHWIDFIKFNLDINNNNVNFNFYNFDQTLNFHKKIIINLNDDSKNALIDIDLNCNQNFPNYIKYKHNSVILNFFAKLISYIFNKFYFLSPVNTNNKTLKLKYFYQNFLIDIKKNQTNYINKLERKTKLIEKIWEQSILIK